MDAREWSLTQHLKAHDPELFCQRTGLQGAYHVYRKSVAWESFAVEGGTLHYSRPSRNFCFALTEDWQAGGKPREWGIEPVIQRAKETSFERSEQLFAELIQSYQKSEESNERDLNNQTESFLKEFRPQYAKAFNDINTSTLEKVDPRRKHGTSK